MKVKFDPDGLKKSDDSEYVEEDDLGDLETEDVDDEDLKEEEEEEEEEEDLYADDDDDEISFDEDEEEDEKKEEEEEDEEEEDEEDTKTIERLLKRIDELSSAQPQIAKVSLDKPIDFDVLTDEDFEAFQAAESKEEMNKIFNKALNAGLLKSLELAESRVSQKMEKKMTANKIAEQFYRENEDLAPVSNYVLSVAQTIAKDEENKELSLAQLLDKAGGLARKALGLKKPSKGDGKDGKKRKTKVPGPKGSRAGKKSHKRSKEPNVRDEIDELVNHFKPRSLK
jgi:hypothetical protein